MLKLIALILYLTAQVYTELASPTIKIYQVDDRNKVLKILGDLPDSEVIIESIERVRLDCESNYPVQWVYTGNGVPVLLSNIRQDSDDKYTASIFINSLKEHHSGQYSCSSTESADKASAYFYLYIPGPQIFVSNGLSGHQHNTVYIPKNDSKILIPCATSSPNVLVTLEKSKGEILVPIEVDNVHVKFESRRGFILETSREDPAGIYLCTARFNGLQRSVEYTVAHATAASAAALESAAKYSDSVIKCSTHDDCPATMSCYTDLTCKDPCVNSIRCGENSVCKYKEHRPYCECPPEFVGDPMKECFNTLQGSEPVAPPVASRVTEAPAPSGTKSCYINQECQQHEKCLNRKCVDPCNTRLCGKNAYCVTEYHTTSCQCNYGYPLGDPNGVLGCSPLNQADTRVDPLREKQTSAVSNSNRNYYIPLADAKPCKVNRDCEADQICRTHVGSYRVCVQVCGEKVCGVNSNCQPGNSTFHQPNCVCNEGYTGEPLVGCDSISNQKDCVVDNDCPAEQKCEHGKDYKKCVHVCAQTACPLNLECESFEHEARCICPPGFTGSEHVGCNRDVTFIVPLSGGSVEVLDLDGTGSSSGEVQDPLCAGLICGEGSECRIELGQPKCYCQSGYTGSPPRCRKQCSSAEDCPSHKTCVANRCRSVCRNRCAVNATCRVGTTGFERFAVCQCNPGYTGNAEAQCSKL